MRKSITKIICVATATISAIGICAAAGCGSTFLDEVKEKDTTANAVSSNGGFLVQTGDYAYFINGAESNTASNKYGSVLKGSVQRISKSDLAAHNYSSTRTVVPSVVYSANYNAGIYIYGDYIYYSTPSTSKNSDGEVQNSKLEFKRTGLDGKDTTGGYFYQSASTSLDYRYVEIGDTVYLMYALSESLYDESTAVTNIHSVNTATGADTLIAYNVSEYSFDTADPTNPYVFYTMSVTVNIGSENSFQESYNQLYMARADVTQPKEYDFSYLGDDYDPDENPLYVNCGDHVLDGIGVVEYGDNNENRRNQFNYGYDATKDGYGMDGLAVNYTGYTYKAVSYKDGLYQFTATHNGESKSGLYRLTVADVDGNSDGKVDGSWNAISANGNLKDEQHLILNVSDSNEYNFVTLPDGTEKVLYSTSSGIELAEIDNGEVKNNYAVTDSGLATFLAVRKEQTSDGGEHLYVYYSLSGGNGYTVYRVAIDGAINDYPTNKLPYEENDTYEQVRVLDIDAKSDWYKPEFVGNQILFASETTGMTSYNYIMACDLEEDGKMMSNTRLKEYNEQLQAVFDKINEYDEEKNSDDSTAYEHLSSALKYLFYTGDREYLAELIKAYQDILGKDEEYAYSKASAQIYLDFADVAGDWADYKADTKKVDGKDVYANSINYYYSVVGRMTDEDTENRITGLKASYMESYPVEETTWWGSFSTVSQVFIIIGFVLAGAAVIGLGVWLYIFLKKRKEEKAETDGKLNVDITDDKDIDVYND